MTAEAIITISAAVVALTQIVKWSGVPDRFGPAVVLVLSLLGVILWGVSTETGFDRALLWPYFAAAIGVATSAAGVYGFTRAAASSLTRTTPPPSTGAGSERTTH